MTASGAGAFSLLASSDSTSFSLRSMLSATNPSSVPSLPSAGSLFLFCFASVGFRGGLLVSTSLSCTLLAELAVGRIILARKPSSGGFELAWDVERSGAVFSDGRDDLGRTPVAEPLLEVLSLDLSVDGLRLSLSAAAEPDGCPASIFAAEDAVGAVAEPGRRNGRVGDFGVGLWKVEGEGCVFFFVGFEATEVDRVFVLVGVFFEVVPVGELGFEALPEALCVTKDCFVVCFADTLLLSLTEAFSASFNPPSGRGELTLAARCFVEVTLFSATSFGVVGLLIALADLRLGLVLYVPGGSFVDTPVGRAVAVLSSPSFLLGIAFPFVFGCVSLILEFLGVASRCFSEDAGSFEAPSFEEGFAGEFSGTGSKGDPLSTIPRSPLLVFAAPFERVSFVGDCIRVLLESSSVELREGEVAAPPISGRLSPLFSFP